MSGIYALESLRREAPETGGAIVEVLSAFIRREVGKKYGSVPPPSASVEVQAALAVLGRPWHVTALTDKPLDLHGMALRHAYLPLVHFQRAFLYDCDLEGALLVGAHLQGAWFGRTNLRNANLDEAHLEGADLSTARNLKENQLKTALLDGNTRLPVHLTGDGISLRPAFLNLK